MIAALLLSTSLMGQLPGTGGLTGPPGPIVFVVPPGIAANIALMDTDTAVRNIAARKGFRDPFPNRPPLGLPSGTYLFPVWWYSPRY